jgi:hypothetical protein
MAAAKEQNNDRNLHDLSECDAPAEIRWQFVLESTDGPIEHAAVACVQRHWFMLPVAYLEHSVSDGMVVAT